MPGLVFFSSASGNTLRFVTRLFGGPGPGPQAASASAPERGLYRIPISPKEPGPDPSALTAAGGYVLICPTFADGEGRGAVPKQVIRFLNDPGLRAGIRGVIAGGNRNFGATFALAGKVIATKCNVPLLYSFELAGTETDIARVRRGLDLFWGTECSTMA
ncbi:class Ib ribonucleoside-diphosphate reductase assembly flavoprotein NrdI [Xinfangfangia sp. D13-10-4-6]|uniref:class Ib ribonucleoside-diphosphate reductase assembly flavoprotein NrdI n=1 Tax=Pseudogemmobacter hezensis TaxID=2737662 RepID=UPI001553D681|nr:class Ib ribonucleoside-diphosphate reductase assembly flavoprotein NrdI [Pseudogemmobacter hezensis]NPD16885.1 class Ib ribonucleoside-diphosphate reductase assembly flavoprotein NrdI [Pseudogemmobacter hezensis]